MTKTRIDSPTRLHRRTRANGTWILVLLALLLGACDGNGNTPPWVSSQLYFGMQTPTGVVSEQDFDQFLDDTVTPRFPDGLTHFAAEGRYRMLDGRLIREPTRVVEILHTDTADAATRLDEIVDVYKVRFEQESVLLIQQRPQRVRF
ncbi:MAG: DUF3574 domain-containing protein [Chromatiales bacterium]|jgi:hypothetical protein|nr:DUF3574 domain-containing protein [Chromatiales bacterium]MDX9767946.1 DUF3574 domain-containing protein [Ectothiorhodospiraceae bacterium]